MSEDSVFNSLVNKSKTEKKSPIIWRVLSIVLAVMSIASIFFALIAVVGVTGESGLAVEKLWLFFLFALVPASSVVFGITMKTKGYRFKKNIIIGIIMTVILCVYGSFSFLFAGVYNHSAEMIVRVEQTVGIDIPEHKQINTQDLTKGGQNTSSGYVYYISDVYFDKVTASEFEKQIRFDKKWLTAMPNELVGITSPLTGSRVCDRILIYNTDTREYNSLPDEEGTYRYISIFYYEENNRMEITEYDIDYVK